MIREEFVPIVKLNKLFDIQSKHTEIKDGMLIVVKSGTQKIAIFKNGTGFYIKSGNITTQNNKYILTQIPNALFGTLWINEKAKK